MEMVKMSEAIKSLDQLLQSHLATIESERKETERRGVLPPGPPEPLGHPDPANPFLSMMSERFGLHTADEKVPIVQQKPVRVRIVFMKIGAIDTIHDRFTADVLVETQWTEPALDGSKMPSEDVDWGLYWNPKLSVSNAIGDIGNRTDYHVVYDKQGRATVIEKQHLAGQFFEFMELNRFPFDKQDLTVTVSSEREVSEVDVCENPTAPCSVNHDAFASEQEWVLNNNLNVWTKLIAKKAGDVSYTYPSLGAAVKVSRRPQFFMWNIVVVLFSICALAFTTFAIEMEKPESRMPLTFTLLLTTVTFKLVVNKNLPKISYLTYLDKYILGTMIILVALCTWHAIAGGAIASLNAVKPANGTACPAYPTKYSTQIEKYVDRAMLCLFGGIYAVFHLVFVIAISCVSTNKEEGVNEEIVESTLNEMDMGADTGDLLSQRRNERGDRRAHGGQQEQPNFVIAAFGD